MFLSLVFHNHQPVGQLPWVFDEAHRDAYEPFLDVLEAHPQIKVALHYTGPLLDWLVQHQPRTVERVREMVSRGQVEVLGGGYYEPILAIWPRDDQHAQLQLLSERVLEVFGREPLGAWLAERVWEPSLIASMGDAKLLYTFVDSTVFEAAGVLEKNSLGSFVARDNDKSLGEKSLTVFPINQSLRHRIPWHDAQDSIDYLKTAHERAGAQSLAVFADDGEKFGAWPGTFNFIYNEQWLDKFFTAIEAQSDWLQTVTPREWSSTRDVLGEVDLPAGSYGEMQSWSRGNWRNFLQMYRESRDLYEDVLRVREIVKARGSKPEGVNPEAMRGVLAAQSNDALWHGAFGGLYLRHLRQAIYARTTEAQVLAEGKAPFARVEVEENGDAILENERVKIGVRPDHGSIFNWTSKAARHNVLSTLRRYREDYHTPDMAEDWYPRGALIDHFFSEHCTLHNFAQAKFAEQGDFASEEWQMQAKSCEENCEENGVAEACVALQREGGVWQDEKFQSLSITKVLTLQAGSDDLNIEYSIRNTSDQTLSLWWGNEWNVAVSGVDAPTRGYHALDRHQQWPLDEEREFHGVKNPLVSDSWLQLGVEWQWAEETEMWHAPIWSVSQKEGGAIERSHQSSAFVFHRRLLLAPQIEYSWKFVASLHSPRAL